MVRAKTFGSRLLALLVCIAGVPTLALAQRVPSTICAEAGSDSGGSTETDGIKRR